MKLGLTVIAAVLLTASVSFAQTNPDTATLERKLQDTELALARVDNNPGMASEFKDLQDDVAYLRVKARRGLTVTARERRDTGMRIDAFATRVQARVAANTPRGSRDGRYDAGQGRNERGIGNDRSIPSGSEVDVRLLTRLYSDTAKLEDPVEATTIVDLYRGDDLIVPAGSLLTGYVAAVDRASRTDRKGTLSVQFNRLSVNGRTRDVSAHVTQALESSGIKGEAGRIGTGAGVGAIIGGILGGVKGAIAGILIGGGGVIAATEGKDVDLPVGTVLRVRFEDTVPLPE